MPFGGYTDFKSCVAKNQKVKDPKAYCAAIKHKTEDKHTKEGEDLKARELNTRSVVDVTEAEFSRDEETGKMTANIILIKAGRAKNPRNYRPSALQRAAKEGMYNGLRMFVNHSNKPPLSRAFGEMVSAVESTEWDPTIKPKGGIRATTEIFDKDFFEKAQRAKKYVGVSADHRIAVNYVQEGAKKIQDVHSILEARSVDWVIFPSAGGEIVDFAREAEGAEQVEWADVTLEDLKANAPDVLTAYREDIIKQAQESGPDDEPDDDDDEEGAKPLTVTRSELAQIVKEQVEEVQTAAGQNAAKATAATKKVTDFVGKSGLKPLTQARIVNQFAGKLEYDEEAVKESIESAKAELREAGAGPRVSNMGPSGSGEGDEVPVGTQSVSVRESVESAFGIKRKGDDDKDKE